MADQNNAQQGQGNQGQQQQRREPPRLTIIHHEFGRKPKKNGGDLQNSVTIWVTKENVGGRPEEVYCSFRVNGGQATQEQLLGEDGTCTEILSFRGMRPHVEVLLNWRHDRNPAWRSLGYMEFADPDKNPADNLLFQRMFLALWKWLADMRAKIEAWQERRRERRQQEELERARAAEREARRREREAQRAQGQLNPPPNPNDQIY